MHFLKLVLFYFSRTLNDLRHSVRLDLRSSQMNSWLRGCVTEFRCIFADCDTGHVELHSGRRRSLAGCNSDVQELYLAPIVANLLDSVEFVAKVSMDLVSFTVWALSMIRGCLFIVGSLSDPVVVSGFFPK